MSERKSDPLQGKIAELQEAVSALEEAGRQVREGSYTGRSKDRCVEVTVGAQGEVTGVKFLADKHRSLSGPELGASVLEAAQRARGHMAQEMLDTFRPLTEQTAAVRKSRESGTGVDWDELFGQFEEAVSAAGAPRRRKRKTALRDEIVEDAEASSPRDPATGSGSGREQEGKPE